MEPTSGRCGLCHGSLPPRPVVRRGPGGESRYCCEACAAVAGLLAEGAGTDVASGRLDASSAPALYDRLRERGEAGVFAPWGSGGAAPAEGGAEAGGRRGGPRARLTLDVAGMRCLACAWLIERRLAAAPGVLSCRSSYALDRVSIEFDPLETGPQELVRAVGDLGYAAAVRRPGRPAGARASRMQADLSLRLALALLFSMAAMEYRLLLYAAAAAGAVFASADAARFLWLLATPVQFWSGLPLYRRAWAGLRRRALGADLLISLGTIATYAFSVAAVLRGTGEVFFETGTMIIGFALLGRVLERRAREGAAEAVDGLLALSPRKATVLEGGEVRTVAAEEVRPGQAVRVGPGEPVPVDGRVVAGTSWVEEAMFTGEPEPRAAGPGSRVRAGSRNGLGELVVRAEAAGGRTLLGGILRAAEEAAARRGRTERLADRAAAFFVPVVGLIALVTGLAWWEAGEPGRAVLAAAGVLVVACPCALGLAVPLAAALGVARGLREGIVIGGADVLERAGRIDTVVFDKTGTLTRGSPRLARVLLSGEAGCDEASLLALAAAVEAGSGHPLAAGLAAAAAAWGRRLPSAVGLEAVPGAGVIGTVEGRRLAVGSRRLMSRAGLEFPEDLDAAAEREGAGRTLAFVGWHGRVRGCLLFDDPLRDDAPATVARLLARGLEVHLLTGDGPGPAARVAAACGIAPFRWGLSPEEKAAAVEGLRRSGRRVAFVGDGANDGPALAAADVGIAVGAADALPAAAAGAVVLAPGVAGAARVLDLARRTAAIMRQNLLWAFAYNAAAVPAAAAGLVHPAIAAAAMALSSLTVVLNSLRLRSERGVPG